MKPNDSFEEYGVPTYSPDDPNFKIVKRTYEGKEVDVIFRKGKPGMTLEELQQRRANGEEVDAAIVPKKRFRSYVATEVAPHIICQQDVPMQLRDGTTIYTDIYRPANTTEPVPVIISWSPYGKRPSEGQDAWQLMGVPPQTVSTMAKFESADPGYWCHYGYAIANVDTRGIGNNEGDLNLWGIEDAQDGYDYIEWLAEQPWCNGRVTMFGNSGVCMPLWKVAATQPPHLCCIAAWEGTGDMYRESLTFNGVPRPMFENWICSNTPTSGWVEDNCNMLMAHPYYDEFWRSKTVQWSKIKVPAYVCAGMCHFHLRGSVMGFRKIRSAKKWLRMHRDMEWPDTYNPENLEDLRKFFDRYCKDIHNGWEFTPRVRMDIMDAYNYDFEKNHAEDKFPVARTEYRKLYLDARDNSMSPELPEVEAEVAYEAHNHVDENGKETGGTSFKIKFNEDTLLMGYMRLHLFLEVRGYDNADMFVFVTKRKDGEYVPIDCMGFPYRGAWGQSRAARRELDEKESTIFQPVMAHQKDEPLEPGQIVEVDVEIHPHSRIWHAGEELVVDITPDFIKTEWYEDGKMNFATDNGPEGTMDVIHTGGQYASYLQIPVIPPKWQSGSYTYWK